MADAYATLLANSILSSGDAWTLLTNPLGLGQIISDVLGTAMTNIDEYGGAIITEEISSVVEEITETPGSVTLDEITVIVPEDGSSTGIVTDTNINGDVNNA